MKATDLLNFVKFLRTKRNVKIEVKDYLLEKYAHRFIAVEKRSTEIQKLFKRLEILDRKKSSHKVVSEIIQTSRQLEQLLKSKI